MKNELDSAKICHIAKFMLIELLASVYGGPTSASTGDGLLAIRKERALSNAITH